MMYFIKYLIHHSTFNSYPLLDTKFDYLRNLWRTSAARPQHCKYPLPLGYQDGTSPALQVAESLLY